MCLVPVTQKGQTGCSALLLQAVLALLTVVSIPVQAVLALLLLAVQLTVVSIPLQAVQHYF